MKKLLALIALAMLLVGACSSPPEIVIETVVVEITSTTEPTATVEPTATAEPDIAETGVFGRPVEEVADYLADKLDIRWSFKTTPQGTFAVYNYNSHIGFGLSTFEGSREGPLETILVQWDSMIVMDFEHEYMFDDEAREIAVWFYDAIGIEGVSDSWEEAFLNLEDEIVSKGTFHWGNAGFRYTGYITKNYLDGKTTLQVALRK